ncbi:MAG: NfeD family protein [Acutalibacteraceae bacterium]|nr:NfeD family protein [Clostridia bacterium]MEE3449182.1 NfeD family protein [Acutalibacteraceae bacterium]
MDYLPYVWIAVMVIMAVAEGLTTQLVSVWFVVGALAAAIVSFFVPNLAIQLALFVGVSLFMLIITKPYVQKARQVKTEATNADRNIGKIAVVTQEINNTEGTGQVKVSGNTWTARTENNQIISEGTKVTVKEISGVKLIVTPVVSTEK